MYFYAIQTKLSFSTIRDVVYRTNSLTKLNAKAITLLLQTAIKNSVDIKLKAEEDFNFLEGLLKH